MQSCTLVLIERQNVLDNFLSVKVTCTTLVLTDPSTPFVTKYKFLYRYHYGLHKEQNG